MTKAVSKNITFVNLGVGKKHFLKEYDYTGEILRDLIVLKLGFDKKHYEEHSSELMIVHTHTM